MATTGCVFHRTLSRSKYGTNKAPPTVCRELVTVLDLQRYSRDQGSSIYFPQAVLKGVDLYDITLSDGDCRLRVTLDPSLNQLVERNVLRPGSRLRNSTFTPALAARLPECPGVSGDRDSFRLLGGEVSGQEDEGQEVGGAWRLIGDSLPWFGSSESAGPVVPLRANRSIFLPLWNNVDYSGEEWRDILPTEDEDREEEEEMEGWRPAVTVSELRNSFLWGRSSSIARGTVRRQLIVRIINKSHLMYFGRAEQNCDCPYKAVVQVCDNTGSVCVVLWNSVCVKWYCHLKPGDIISLSHYRVKRCFQAETEDIELSVNSRNPAARISILPQSSVSPEHVPPAATYSFYTSKELLDRPNGDACDVIGLITFSGRAERIRSRDGNGMELLEYRWLRLEDGTSDQPIMVKLFSTSQPEAHHRLHPMSVVVCTRLMLIKVADWTGASFYLTNSVYTQVYCTGLGHHSQMSYRKLRPVQRFLQWMRSQDDRQVLNRALIGGFYLYPPPPISLETFMTDRQGKPGFLRGAEFEREVERLCYRERHTLCIQATVTMIAYSCRGEEDRCLFWTHRAPPPSPGSTPSSSSRLSSPSPHPSPSRSFSSTSSTLFPLTPPSFRSPLCSPSSFTPLSSASCRLKSRLPDNQARKSWKRKLLKPDAPYRRHPSVTLQPEHTNSSVVLFQASMEFLENDNEDTDEDEALSFATASECPVFQPVAMETLPMRYDHAHREEQSAVVAMGGQAPAGRKFGFAFEHYFTLRLKALSDSVLVDAIFLPVAPPSSLRHSNTWISILSHGAFSSHTPPPSPADLIAMASQLANQRLICVLEVCHLGGTATEIILTRGFLLEG